MKYHIYNLTLKRLAKLPKADKLHRQLATLAVPLRLRIGWKEYAVPITVNDLMDNICWGQRLFMATEHESNYESFLYFVANYYQPIVTGRPYDEQRVAKFFKSLARCHAIEVYPVLMRLVSLFEQMVAIERDKLHSAPDKDMEAAEVHRLKPFTDLNILELISEKTRRPLDTAHLVEYNVAFALLWFDKESADFNKRYSEILIAKSKRK